MGFEAARRVLERAVGAHLFPGAAADVGSSRGSNWDQSLGSLTFSAGSPPATRATVFDLASLTKVIATTTLVLDMVSRGALRLDERLAHNFREWRGTDRESATIRDLLEHASGLPARLLDAPPTGRREFEYEICLMPLEYPPRTRSVYSDLGFILLGFVVVDRSRRPFAHLFEEVRKQIAPHEPGVSQEFLAFGPVPAEEGGRVAPTHPLDDDVRRGRLLVGEVHDSYASALGGAAGHAGLFGTAAAVAAFARVVLRAARGDAAIPPPLSSAVVRRAVERSSVPASSRALGWDTMLPTSSCGVHMSVEAFGHVGFTGTSLWIDPQRDRYFVLLTNRACGGGSPDEMRDVRRAFHDALADV